MHTDMDAREINKLLEQLSLPKQAGGTLSFCAATPEAFKSHLEQLPHINPAELSNRLYRILPELAGLNVPAGRKLALLDLARPEVFNCVERLTKNLALGPNTTKTLSLAIAMLKYLAEGYKAVFATSMRMPAAPPNIVVSSGYAAVEIIGQILLECSACYINPPANTWLELHSIYQAAKLRNLDSISLESQRITTEVDATIRAAYVTPLLLACADPARFAPQELRRITAFLRTTANLVDFAQNHLEGIFVVNSQSDKGPQYSFKVEGTTNRHFRLRTNRLVRHLQDKLNAGTLSSQFKPLAPNLCQYWSQEIHRREEPKNDHSDAILIFGLGNIHRELSGTNSLEDYLQCLQTDGAAPKHHVEIAGHTHPSHRDNLFLSRGNGGLDMAIKDKPITYAKPGATLKPLRKYKAKRINFSSKGARFEFSAPSETLTTGEMVAAQQMGTGDWRIGLVRWIRVTPRLDRVIGVEFIPHLLEPCAVSQKTAGTEAAEQHYPALLNTQQALPCLLVSALPFREYSNVQLLTPRGRKPTKLLNLLNTTFHIACFKLEAIDRGNNLPTR